jgi:hypothetical protein
MLSLPEEGSKTVSETSCFMKNYPMEKIQKRRKLFRPVLQSGFPDWRMHATLSA